MNIPEKTVQEVKSVAYEWQKKIQVSRKGKEQDFHNMMLKMLKNPVNKIFLIELLDQSFRSKDADRVADQLEHILLNIKALIFSPSLNRFLSGCFVMLASMSALSPSPFL